MLFGFHCLSFSIICITLKLLLLFLLLLKSQVCSLEYITETGVKTSTNFGISCWIYCIAQKCGQVVSTWWKDLKNQNRPIYKQQTYIQLFTQSAAQQCLCNYLNYWQKTLIQNPSFLWEGFWFCAVLIWWSRHTNTERLDRLWSYYPAGNAEFTWSWWVRGLA